jgi:hypothetical protein
MIRVTSESGFLAFAARGPVSEILGERFCLGELASAYDEDDRDEFLFVAPVISVTGAVASPISE